VLNLGFGEIAVILVVALVFIGPKMLPELATNLGKAIREIRKATSDIRQEIELDEAIRRPLQELRDAATLPPEELKRRDELLASERKAAEEEKQQEKVLQDSASGAADSTIVDPTILNSANAAGGSPAGNVAKFTGETIAREKPVASPGSIFPAEVISAGGTMILHPPSLEQELTPTIEFDTPSPVIVPTRPLPPPPLPPIPPSVPSTNQASSNIPQSGWSPIPAMGSSITDEVTTIDQNPVSPVTETPSESKKPTTLPGSTVAAKPSKQANPSASRSSSRKKKA
jgi:Tat protein translocase TatB subunit